MGNYSKIVERVKNLAEPKSKMREDDHFQAGTYGSKLITESKLKYVRKSFEVRCQTSEDGKPAIEQNITNLKVPQIFTQDKFDMQFKLFDDIEILLKTNL